MARRAGRWIGGRYVVGYARAISLRVCKISLVTTVAIRRGIAAGVVAAQVTVSTGINHRSYRACNRGARRQHVRTLQRETSGAVIKFSIGPQDGIVAG